MNIYAVFTMFWRLYTLCSSSLLNSKSFIILYDVCSFCNDIKYTAYIIFNLYVYPRPKSWFWNQNIIFCTTAPAELLADVLVWNIKLLYYFPLFCTVLCFWRAYIQSVGFSDQLKTKIINLHIFVVVAFCTPIISSWLFTYVMIVML